MAHVFRQIASLQKEVHSKENYIKDALKQLLRVQNDTTEQQNRFAKYKELDSAHSRLQEELQLLTYQHKACKQQVLCMTQCRSRMFGRVVRG